ncbi:MAG: GNAT family N-acetyltransferase [Actinobacteria bacterium]|nr:GNAT family N-acetyltransferase [Actinomycetota bacterium]MCA1720308.1 GNAT family N-acetyltransferase [Actinomycetota bacterium]
MSLLDRIDAYCDAVPRSAALVEEFGPLRLFVPNGSGHPWYARPVAADVQVTADDVQRVLARQCALGLPVAVEWLQGRPEGLEQLAAEAGLHVHRYPLMAAERVAEPASVNADVRLLGPDDDLAGAAAVADIGFGAAGTAVGEQGVEALARKEVPDLIRHVAEGTRAVAAAFLDGQPVARGGIAVVGDVCEIAGVATLPGFRRRGLGAAVTYVLAQEAARRGARLLWLMADSDDVARIYGGLGFERVGIACAAEAAGA